ncbi:S49 family peptidase [Rhizobium alvei]|uniref:S49 family peptidase n=1 Tax=Rhizobium alvei TaxID=1132659 RepID=A0ABT8YJV0_9HYPH|nr:S49 family peptidase [Rhizobium alvei]MDO6963988.1 S49 family peptidase [Rhizobium alvei]
MRLLDYASSAAWALLPERADELVSIADRAHQTSPEILEAYRAQGLERAERARIRGDVALINVEGPLFKKANLFVEFSGATSYQILRRDLQAALDDQRVGSILLIIDSPGGEANGCDELASAIYAARAVKPVTAYVSGMAASGGYWIASAASRIIISEAAMLGSIGVVVGMKDARKAEEWRGVKTHEFVSSQSPGKRPDPDTPEGQGRMQQMVDDLASVFIDAVARHRGVTSETVVKKFGAGGILIGKAAVRAGMADEVGQLEATIAAMQGPAGRRRAEQPSRSVAVAAASTVYPKVEADLDAAGRIQAILESENGKLMPTLANHLAFKSSESLETCVSILAAARISYDRALIESAPSPETVTADYFNRKAKAGAIAIGGGMPQPSSLSVAETWKTAMERANARFETSKIKI